jgi:hypothetical protein
MKPEAAKAGDDKHESAEDILVTNHYCDQIR